MLLHPYVLLQIYTEMCIRDRAGVATGAQVNVIEKVSVNGTALTVTSKGVNVSVPTGALARKDKVAEADLDTTLAGKVQNSHSHTNKAVLDGITTAKVTAWNSKGTVYVPVSYTHLDVYKRQV